jgi:quercetin dioxygenase-like cupin family protein
MTKPQAYELRAVPVHLGPDARAEPIEGWAWDAPTLAAYDQRVAAEGEEGRLITWFEQSGPWATWERHPAGDEVVVLLSGRADLIQELDGVEHRVPMAAGDVIVNPAGVWHTADVHEPGAILTVTPGRGTENRPR